LTGVIAQIRRRFAWTDTITLLVIALLLAIYLYNLTGWRIHDDEGEYLYQVWRMTLGEQPYRDFLTPQLPVYLYLGAGVMKLAGPSLLFMRLYSVGLAFTTAIMLYLLGRRRGHWLVGLVAAFIFLSHADVFKNTRIYRNEPLFLFLVTAGLVVATWWPVKKRRLLLTIAGVLFGLATMVKLFGVLPFGGICLWLIWDQWRKRQPLRQLIYDLMAFIVPYLLGLLVISGISVMMVPDFFDFVLGHHLAQGSQQSFQQIISTKLQLYWEYLKLNPVLVLLAIVSGVMGLIRKDARQAWAWQLPTAGAFFLLSRELGERQRPARAIWLVG
jgi:4-amino-4-deoxy-L-arabinose transferase-like glycosyltransferase